MDTTTEPHNFGLLSCEYDHPQSARAQQKYAECLRIVLDDLDSRIRFENANAGTCAVLERADGLEIWYGGDAAHEGWIGLSIHDASNGDHLHDIHADTWSQVQTAFNAWIANRAVGA